MNSNISRFRNNINNYRTNIPNRITNNRNSPPLADARMLKHQNMANNAAKNA